MSFEWDERKRRSNVAKHKVDFADMPPLFECQFLEFPEEQENQDELRMIAIGAIDTRAFVVVYTWRGESRRLISARKATKHEREAYFASLRRAGAQGG